MARWRSITSLPYMSVEDYSGSHVPSFVLLPRRLNPKRWSLQHVLTTIQQATRQVPCWAPQG